MALCLGIDLGTSKIAAVLVDTASRTVLAAASHPSTADLLVDDDKSEQDVQRILSGIDRCIAELPQDLKKKTAAIGVTGQMHGVMFWTPGESETSSLITWQDQRCNSGGFIKELQAQTEDTAIKSGFACASIAWLAKHKPQFLDKYAQSNTIHDYLVARLCGLDRAVTDASDAASWGFFDIRNLCWQLDKVQKAGIPKELLPELIKTGSPAGELSGVFASKWGFKEGIPVIAAIGDNQASLYATLEQPATQIALTLGTGGQLSVIALELNDSLSCPSFEYRPYVDGNYAAVAASLCGGSAFAWLADSVAAWIEAMNLMPPSKDAIYARLIALGLESCDTELDILPSFLGERHNPTLRGSINRIDLNNFSLGNIAAALTRGIVKNLRAMLPSELLSGKTEVVGSGNAIRRSNLMQKTIEDIFKLPLRISQGQEEAASGAALLAARAC